MDAYQYVREAMFLVYATAIFDTFLSDVTKFLIAFKPRVAKDAFSADYDDIESATSIHDLKNKLLSRKVRTMSYRAFNERLRVLKRTFGLKLELDPPTIQLLRDVSDVRNAVSHDQSFLDVVLRDNGDIAVVQKGCPRHPTPITPQLFEKAWTVYIEVMKKLYNCVIEQVICYDEARKSDSMRELLKTPFTELRDSTEPA